LILELSQANCADYLRRRGTAATAVEVLEGGVSSTTLLVRCDRQDFVLKQSLPRLRVASEWVVDQRRILREAEALKLSATLLPSGAAPQLLWTDTDNLIIAMTALNGPSWKRQLLAGVVEEETAYTAGLIAGRLAGGEVASGLLEDRSMFHDLRTSPYYRQVARRHPDLEPQLSGLIYRLETDTTGFVHGDFSPKNMIVTDRGPALIDFECAHLGDASFDGAFCLNHLILKAIHLPPYRHALACAAQAYWAGLVSQYRSQPYERGVLSHLGGLMLARVDGKSPAEYLTESEAAEVKRFARGFLRQPPASVADVITWIRTL
jgi:tRNA A-37 threonylcarbamoyl transferase component Bud32